MFQARALQNFKTNAKAKTHALLAIDCYWSIWRHL